MIDNLRILAALKLGQLAHWVLGSRPVPENEQIRRMRQALGDITTLLPADHPACRAALRALASDQR